MAIANTYVTVHAGHSSMRFTYINHNQPCEVSTIFYFHFKEAQRGEVTSPRSQLIQTRST